jgi:hypothetical protein
MVLDCPSFLPLIPVKVETSSSQIANLSNLAYCADTTDSQRAIVFTFATPKILERIRFEKINNGMPQLVSIEYANNENGQFLSNANLSHIEMGNVEVNTYFNTNLAASIRHKTDKLLHIQYLNKTKASK